MARVQFVSPCLSFDGLTNKVGITAIPTVWGNAFTVEAWINTNTIAAGLRYAFDTKESQGRGFFLKINQVAGKARVGVNLGVAGIYVELDSVTSLAINTWYHLAGTWDGTTLKLYINGVLDASSTP